MDGDAEEAWRNLAAALPRRDDGNTRGRELGSRPMEYRGQGYYHGLGRL